MEILKWAERGCLLDLVENPCLLLYLRFEIAVLSMVDLFEKQKLIAFESSSG